MQRVLEDTIIGLTGLLTAKLGRRHYAPMFNSFNVDTIIRLPTTLATLSKTRDQNVITFVNFVACRNKDFEVGVQFVFV